MSWWRRWLLERRLRRLRDTLAPSDPRFAQYLRDYRAPTPGTAVAESTFVVVDTEATGLDLTHDRVLSIAAIRIRGVAILPRESLELTIAHDRVGATAAPIHGMVTEDLACGMSESEAVAQFFELLGCSVFVAHHAAFDHGMLSAASERAGGPPLLNPVLDTEQLARRLELGPVPSDSSLRFSLDAVAERYGLETDARHTAAGDTLLTAELLLRLLVGFGPSRSLGDLLG